MLPSRSKDNLPKYAVVNTAASGDTPIVALVAGRRIRLLGYTLVADGTVAVTWRSNATPLTGAMALVVNSVLESGDGSLAGLLETAEGEALNINLSLAVGVRGHVKYIEV